MIDDLMKVKMRVCRNCGNYSFKSVCPKCGNETSNPHPPSFSPIDKYGKYRRALKNL